MAVGSTWAPAAEAARLHLAQGAQDASRADRFDMDDGPDLSVLEADPILHHALLWLGQSLADPWTKADTAAIQHRKSHQRLASVAIASGTAAITFAVLLLAIQQSWPEIAPLALVLEAAAAVAAAVAVTVGLIAKYDRHWLGQRYLAERLRMLKFQALARPELWAGNSLAWQQWVENQKKRLNGAHEFERIQDWAYGGTADQATVSIANCADLTQERPHLIVYYQMKRLGFQAEYFRKLSDQRTRQVRPFRHKSLQFFVASLACVFLHFLSDLAAKRILPFLAPTSVSSVEIVSIWMVALAAVLPIFGLGLRAWTGALEQARSAGLFIAKHRALIEVSQRIDEDQTNLGRTCQHIANVEHFLEEEHREWLRLLLEAEWFI